MSSLGTTVCAVSGGAANSSLLTGPAPPHYRNERLYVQPADHRPATGPSPPVPHPHQIHYSLPPYSLLTVAPLATQKYPYRQRRHLQVNSGKTRASTRHAQLASPSPHPSTSCNLPRSPFVGRYIESVTLLHNLGYIAVTRYFTTSAILHPHIGDGKSSGAQKGTQKAKPVQRA